MNVRKRFLSVFLSLVLCFVSFFGMFSTSVFAATSGSCGATGSSVSWSYDSGTKTLTITGTGAIRDYSNLQAGSGRVPWYDNREECEYVVIGEGVTRIGDYSFSSMPALQSASMPSTLEEIGERAFMDCTALADCKFPASLKVIEGYAFQNTTSLEDVDFPVGLTTIREFAFNGSGIKEVVFPDSLTSLGMRQGTFGIEYEVGSVFKDCLKLESVTFGTGLTETGINNFEGCTTLREVDFGSSITTISSSSFFGTFITTLVIPETVTTIETLAFANIGTLSHVYIYNSECDINTLLDSDAFNGSQQTVVFHGHSQSTTQAYAEEHGYAFVSIDDCAHSNMYADVTLEATCTTEGSQHIMCQDCGALIRTEVIAALGHDFVTDSTVDNTEIDGHTYEYQTCSRCGTENTVTTHSEWVEGYYTINYTKEPTCTSTGLGTYSCNICGRNGLVPAVVPALGHTIENYTSISPATCTQDGYQTGVCARCGETVTVTLPATGHSEELISTSTTEDGSHTYNEYRCTACGAERSECVHNAWVESYYTEDVVSPVSCTSAGSIERTCTVDGCTHVETITQAPLGHEFDGGVVTVEPTCTEAGTTTITCQNCGTSYDLPFPSALGHDYSEDSVLQEPTCTTIGTGQHKCSRCDSSTTYQIPALGHDIENAEDYTVITQANCTVAGVAAGTCANCGEYIEVEIPSGGHVYDPESRVVVTEPTCEAEGLARETCSVCGAQQEVTIPATGHTYRYDRHTTGSLVSTWLTYKCTVCGAEQDEEQTTVQLSFMLYFNEKREDVTNGYLYDVNYDGYINSRDYAIILQYAG